MKRKYNKNKVVKKAQPEEKLYTKADLNKAKVEGWNRALESLTEQVNEISTTRGTLWFLFGDMNGRSDIKSQVLQLLKNNIYSV
jgi:hypothetical protein